MLSSVNKSKIANLIAKNLPRLWMERELHFRPNHFEREFWLIPFLCDKTKTSLDIGANMGHYSYFMQKFSMDVIAFEPNTQLWPDLRRLLGKDFQLEAVALSDKLG